MSDEQQLMVNRSLKHRTRQQVRAVGKGAWCKGHNVGAPRAWAGKQHWAERGTSGTSRTW